MVKDKNAVILCILKKIWIDTGRVNQSGFYNFVFQAHLIDCGGFINVPENALRPLPPDLSKHRQCALIVTLADIVAPGGSTTWPASTIDCLRSMLNSNKDFYIVKKVRNCLNKNTC